MINALSGLNGLSRSSPRSPCERTTAASTISSPEPSGVSMAYPALLEDFEHSAALTPGAGCREQGANGARRATFAADHFTEVALGDRQLDHDGVVAIDRFDFHSVWIV